MTTEETRAAALAELNKLTDRRGALAWSEVGAWVGVHIDTIRAALTPPPPIEGLGEALEKYSNVQNPGKPWKIIYAAAKAYHALTQGHAVKAGWKLVPVEPTEEMVNRGWAAWNSANPFREGITKQYRAMIEAAPPATDRGE